MRQLRAASINASASVRPSCRQFSTSPPHNSVQEVRVAFEVINHTVFSFFADRPSSVSSKISRSSGSEIDQLTSKTSVSHLTELNLCAVLSEHHDSRMTL